MHPIALASRQKKADAFAHKGWQLLSKAFHFLPHQGTHEHWKQNEIHKDLCCAQNSFGAERCLCRARKNVGRLVQKLGYSIRGPVSGGFMYIATQGRKSLCFSDCSTHDVDRVV